MHRWLAFLVLALLLVSTDSDARRRKKEAPIVGRVVIKSSRASTPALGAFWKFSDPFAAPSSTTCEKCADLAVVVFHSIGGQDVSPTVRVEGMAFEPKTKILNYTQDLEIENAMGEDITVYSPGRVRDRRDLEPLLVPAGGSAVFTVGPSDEEASDRSVQFWAFPLRLKGYPFARGWAIFVRSHYFSNVGPDGSFKIPPLPPGEYELNFIYKGRLLDYKKKVTIPRRRRPKPVKVTVTLRLED